METNRSKNWGLYLVTLLIELITGLVRMLFTIPLTMVLFLIAGWLLSKIGIEPVDIFRLNVDPQYTQGFVVLIVIVAAILAYANIIASLVAYFGFGGGSLMTRFVLGARKPSSRERETILQVFEQMAEGANFPIRSYSQLYVIDSVLDFANLVGTTLYVSSAGMRGNNLQALIAHEFGHLNNGDGSLILALRRLVFPPFSLFIGGIRDFSTNRPAYRPAVKEFDAIQIFYSMINNIIFFTLAFIGGGIGVWVMSWAWAGYFRARDYVADSFAAGLGYRDLLVIFLEANIYFDTSIPYMLGWHPAAELRIDALQHPALYGLPANGDMPAAAAAFTSLADVQPTTERTDTVTAADGGSSPSSKTVRNFLTGVIIVVFGYLLFRSWPNIQERVGEMIAKDETVLAVSTATVVAGQGDSEGISETVEVTDPPSGPYDCLATVSASRDLEQHGSGDSCWLQLVDGETAVIDFYNEAQITYRTNSSGDDVYFYVAGPGDRLSNVVGATIRPVPFVQAIYGGLEEVKTFEVRYHSPGGQWLACLRDVNNDYQALNSECENEEVKGASNNDDLTTAGNLASQNPVKSRAEMLVDYDSIYNQQGWCSLWDRLIDDGLVNGECPSNVLQFVFEDVPTSNGSVNLLTGLQMSASNDTEVYYQACATFDNNARYTGGAVDPWINNDFIGTNTILHAGSVFTMYFRCDNAWSPPPPVVENPTKIPEGGSNNNSGRSCIATESGPLVQGDHNFQAPVIVIQLWRMNGDSPWGTGEVMTVVENEVAIHGAGGFAWLYPSADCFNVATIDMQGSAKIRESTVVTPEDLRAAGMIN